MEGGSNSAAFCQKASKTGARQKGSCLQHYSHHVPRQERSREADSPAVMGRTGYSGVTQERMLQDPLKGDTLRFESHPKQ